MMGYEGGDLLLTAAAWPTVGSLPKDVGGGLGGRRLRLVSRAHLRWLDRRPSAYTKMRYTNRWPYLTYNTSVGLYPLGYL